jgi:hypothetical protein
MADDVVGLMDDCTSRSQIWSGGVMAQSSRSTSQCAIPRVFGAYSRLGPTPERTALFPEVTGVPSPPSSNSVPAPNIADSPLHRGSTAPLSSRSATCGIRTPAGGTLNSRPFQCVCWSPMATTMKSYVATTQNTSLARFRGQVSCFSRTQATLLSCKTQSFSMQLS